MRPVEVEIITRKLAVIVENLKALDPIKGMTHEEYIQLPLYIRVRVLKEGGILFVRDENQLYELAFRTAQAFEDFKHIYYGYLKEVALAG